MAKKCPGVNQVKMVSKKIYSFEIYDWVQERLPPEIRQVLHDTGWNSFGIYELIKAGLSLERRDKLKEFYLSKKADKWPIL